MNFRQRLSWLIVIGYLCVTFAIFYYIFEISERYNVFALEHVESYHKKVAVGGAGLGQIKSLFSHITDIPLTVWLILLALPYLQVFCLLLACTKPDPRLSLALKWPGILILKCQKLYKRLSGMETKSLKSNSSYIMNGHVVIDA